MAQPDAMHELISRLDTMILGPSSAGTSHTSAAADPVAAMSSPAATAVTLNTVNARMNPPVPTIGARAPGENYPNWGFRSDHQARAIS